MKSYAAVVLAGYSNDHPDPLAAAHGVQHKVLLPIAGRHMIDWTLDALRRSPRVEGMVVVGMDPALGVDLGPDVQCLPNQRDHFDNVLVGIEAAQALRPDNEFVLTVSADVPLLQPQTVDWFVGQCESMSGDVFYAIVEEQVMEAQYAGAGRSYVRLKEGRICGGDLFFVRAAVARNNQVLVRELLARRKNAFQQIRLTGIKTILKFLFHQLSLHDLEQVGSRLLNCEGRGVLSPYADLGMDVDKPHQLAIAQQVLAERRPA
ncbi:MAG: NTP transferase domain-containing protein [Chloroflexi bacterium]|nr:NTP transferase domain-containing protein [Chloroflexota bacterium]